MAATNSATPTTSLTGSTIYRTSARIGPPPREFPTRLVIIVGAAVLVLASVFAGWHYFQPSKSVQQTHAPVRAVDPIPAQDYFKPVPTPKVAPPSTASTAKQLPEHKKFTFDEQAKIIELNSQADADYNQGGCEKALASYQRVLDIDPHDPHAYATVQLCYARARGEEQKTPAATPAPIQDNAPLSK